MNWPSRSPLPFHPPHILHCHAIGPWLRWRWGLMGDQCMLGTRAISADWGGVLNLNLRLWLARLSANQLLTGLYLHLNLHVGGTQQVRRGRLLLLQLWRGGSVLGWRGVVERCRCRHNRRCKRKGRDRGRCCDNWNHWDDSNGDLRRWERGGRRGGRLVWLLTVTVIVPSVVVSSHWLRQWGHKFDMLWLRLSVDELLLFALLFFCKKGDRRWCSVENNG